MRIETIQLKNYRQHQDTVIDFSKNTNYDLHIFIGKNGAGKTNLLSAINWCFYGDEGKVSEESEQLPLVNVISCEETPDSSIDVNAKITLSAHDNEHIEVSRTQHFYFNSQERRPIMGEQDFLVMVSRGDGRDQTLTGNMAIQKLKSIVPEKIKEFFFFDGERLDTYFMTATAQKIRTSIYDISQIEILNILRERLENTKTTLRRSIQEHDPVIKRIESDIENQDNIIKSHEVRIKKCEEQIEIAEEEREILEGRLRNIPDIAHIEQERVRSEERKIAFEKKRDQIILKKDSLLLEWSRLLLSQSALKKGISYIEAKRQQRELPPQVDTQLLNETLEIYHCLVCGRVLDKESQMHVEDLSKEINLTSEIGRRLMDLENIWYRLNERIERIFNENAELTRQIADNEKAVADCEKRIREIDIELSHYSVEEVRILQQQRKECERIIKEQTEQLGVKKRDISFANAKLEDLRNKLVDVEHKKDKDEQRKQTTNLCEKAIDIVTKSHTKIMEDIRKSVEERTKQYFFDLVWKKETFKEIRIDQKFKLHLIDNLGYECLGSISAAERELLALSFTLALHTVSGFDAPLVIDTPLSRVSDDNRTSFAKVLSEVSKNKQIVLLFTHDEYSEEVRDTLQGISSSFNQFEVQSGERITKVGSYNGR